MHVNEAVRQKENTEQLEWLQTHVQFTLDERLVFNSQTNFMGPRKLLHHGRLFKVRVVCHVNQGRGYSLILGGKHEL